jgi:S1-C subfamily serine protease
MSDSQVREHGRRRGRGRAWPRALLASVALLVLDGVAAGCTTAPADGYARAESPARTVDAPLAGVDADELGRARLERALAGVALLLAELPDGHTRFGAALILDGQGHALTSAHVVEGAVRVRAMLYRPGRISYTPMDGGIARLMAENAGDLSVATVLRSDAAADLAVVSLGADTSRMPVLEIADEIPGPGTRVVAIGHPHEAVWSFTAGVVSSRRDGLVQHDAPLGVGSSGGPLLDARGRVLAINTLKVFGGGEGLAFARPMALARALLGGAGTSASTSAMR